VKEILVPLALDELRQQNRDLTVRVASFDLQDVILSNSFGDEMNRIFRSDMENSAQIDLDQWEHPGLCERLEETAARIIEPLL
jgi:hypothetical protein